MTRIPLLLLLAASVATVVAVPLLWLSSRPEPSAGSLEGLSLDVSAVVPARPPVGAPAVDAPPARSTLAAAPAPKPRAAVPVHSARVKDALREQKQPVPVSLKIPALGVAARVVPVGVDRRTRQMALPADSATAAWYRFGASPGQAGSAVIAGHVDYGDGRAVFFQLARLEPGNRVVVGYGNGSTKAFRVIARRLVAKDELPALIFSTSGRPLLTLVTCGGAYDARNRHYLGNTLVFAVPV